jgi:phosphate starvation-inducible membrane PsiE
VTVISAPDDAASPGKTEGNRMTARAPGISGPDRISLHLHRFEIKYRPQIRDALRFLLVLCFLGFFFVLDDFVLCPTTCLSLPRFLGRVLVVVVVALACYLLLVRIEKEQWALVHPAFMNGLGELRANRDYKNILIFVNLCFLAMVAISVASGYIFSRSGTEFVILCVSIGVTINLIALWSLGKGEGP